MSAEDLLELEDHACPTCGSCAGLFTANSMNCLVEAIGIGFPQRDDPGRSTPSASAREARRHAREQLLEEA